MLAAGEVYTLCSAAEQHVLEAPAQGTPTCTCHACHVHVLLYCCMYCHICGSAPALQKTRCVVSCLIAVGRRLLMLGSLRMSTLSTHWWSCPSAAARSSAACMGAACGARTSCCRGVCVTTGSQVSSQVWAACTHVCGCYAIPLTQHAAVHMH